jgi:tetratricopeptide (TPR) repeat protein
MLKFNDALKCYKKAQALINNRYHHKLLDGLASCLTKLSEFDQAIDIYKQIFQKEEGKKKWDAQRSIKFVNKLKRKKENGTLQSIIPDNPSSPDSEFEEDGEE